jgi:hypothetical protein
MSESSKSSPVATAAWTRRPPKPASKKKKKLIAGRELRDRGNRKAYTEPTTDEEFEDDDDDDDDDDVEEIEEAEEEIVALVNDEEDSYEEPKPRTRKIILKLNTEILQHVSSKSTPEANGTGHKDQDEDAIVVAVADVAEDLEAEIHDLKEDAKLDEEEEDDEGGPRRLTRRVTRQSSFSKPETPPERPVHGRKGVGRQDRPSSKPNGDHAPSPQANRRSSIGRRLRKMSRKSREEKKEKKKPKVSESEFEDEGDEPDDDLSIASDKIVDTEEDYSSAPPRRHSRKPQPPSRGRPKRSRNASDDDDSVDDGIDDNELEEELREIGAEIPQRQRQLRPTGRMNYYIPPPPDKDDIFLPPPGSSKKRSGTARGFGGFGGFGGDFSNMGLGNRFRGITGLGTAGGAEDSSDSVCGRKYKVNS